MNPFLFGKTVSDNCFTNREKETIKLKSNIDAGINTIIVSPRRYGKTSLVRNLIKTNSNSKTKFVFLDMFNIRTEYDFYNKFSSKIIEATYSGFEEKINAIKEFLSQFRPSITMDTGIDNEFDFSLSISGKPIEIEEILNLPDKIGKKKKIRIVVCIDEFQNLENFDDPLGFQKVCRSYWQNHKNACYILFGSKQNMLTDIFQKRQAPFYRFGEFISLERIEKQYLAPFIVTKFTESGKSISNKMAEKIVDLVENHPYYAQQLSFIIWNKTIHEVDDEIFETAKESLLDQNTMFYQNDAESLSNSQISFLHATIEKEERINSVKALQKYRLNSSSNISRVKKALVKKEIIEVSGNKILFYDPIFELWLRERYFFR
jgi:uncharacterized protein